MGWNDVESKEVKKTEYTKFDEGSTIIRIVDNEPYSFWSHWMPKHGTGVTCLGKGCPICNVIATQKANKETPTYSSTQRHAVRIINRKTGKMEIMIQGKSFFNQLLTLHREVGDITTYDIKVNRKGKDTDTSYMLLPQPPSQLTDKDKELLEEINFEEAFSPPTKEQMIALMEGKSPDEVFKSSDN